MSTAIAERVAAGAAWLDEHRPGWVDRINLDTLDLSDTCKCVLGQEYGRFVLGDDLILDEGSESHLLGFDVDELRQDGQYAGKQYAALTAAWRELVLARREAAA
jgi:hypothetical protein